MAKATRAAVKPAARPPQTQTRAQQAAQHQNRPAPPQTRVVVPQTRVAPREQGQVRPSPSNEMLSYSGAVVPEYMRGDAGLGKENIGREDLETPRLKLIQGLSPELQAYDDLRPGNFFHSASEFIFNEPFIAVPIFMDKRYILWRPRDSGGGILARADDGIHWNPPRGEFTVQLDKKDGGGSVTWRLAPTVEESGLAAWGSMNPADPNSPPAATLMYSFVLAFPEEPDLMPAVLTFQRSGIKMGRRFNTKLKTTRLPLFGLKFEFRSFMDHNKSGQEFYNVDATSAGLVEDPQLYNQYKELHLSFKEAGLTIKDLEGLQAEEDQGQEAEGDGNAPTF